MSIIEQPNNKLLSLATVDTLQGKGRKLLISYTIGDSIYRLGKNWYYRYKSKTSYTITIEGSDEIYPLIHKWIIDSTPPQKMHSILVRSSNKIRNNIPTDSPNIESEPKKNNIYFFYDDSRSQNVYIEGHKVRVDVIKPGETLSKKSSFIEDLDLGNYLDDKYNKIVFTVDSLEAKGAVLRYINMFTEQLKVRSSRFYLADRWGNWITRPFYPRSIESVILKKGQKERLLKDLEQFLNNENKYGLLSIPYHRGYLFYGPAGTGKTSFVRALTTYFNLDLYYINLVSVTSDDQLIKLISEIGKKAILILEDVDILRSSHNRENEKNSIEGVSLEGLLNCLDGVITPNGLITVMTTNKREVLDFALVRPGRVDMEEEFPKLDSDQLERLISVFFNKPFFEFPKNIINLSPADIVEVIKRNMGDEEQGWADLQERIYRSDSDATIN